MMTSYFNLLKYAATGQASPDMTYYDRMRASTLMGGATVQTLTGIPPLSFKSDGTPLISWSMKGNGQQTGTPTPDNPVMPEFCGVRTGNLLDIHTAEKGRIDNGTVGYESATTDMQASGNAVSFTTNVAYRGVCFGFIEIPSGADSFSFSGTFSGGGGIGKKFVFYDSQKTWLNADRIFSITVNSGTELIPNGAKYVRLSLTSQTAGKASTSDFMLNLGSAALPYEPFGYKLPLTNAGQTVPVYLGQTQTVRRIKKLVLTGEETYTRETAYDRFITEFPNAKIKGLRLTQVYCTHFLSVYDGRSLVDVPNNSIYSSDVANNKFFIKTTEYTTAKDFKSYLAAQYAAGTPVTVWYVLAEPETGIVNEPLAKIGDYADELSSEDAGVTIPTVKGQNTLTVDTELQPSEMTITYRG